MIFLYKLEVLEYDGALTSVLPPASIAAASGARRSVHLLTNYESNVSVSAVTMAGAGQMLPGAAAGGGAESGTVVYAPAAIGHDGLRWDGEQSSGNVSLTLPLAHPVAQLFASDAPSAQVWLTMAAVPSVTAAGVASGGVAVLFVGQVMGGDFDEHRCALNVQHLRTMFDRPALTRKHPRSCPHSLFDPSTCGVNPHAFDAAGGYFAHREDGVVTSIATFEGRMYVNVAVAVARPHGFFFNGFAVFKGSYSTDPGTPDGLAFYTRAAGGLTAEKAAAAQVHGGIRRTIVEGDSVDGRVHLLTPLPVTVAVGDRVTLYRGCDKTPAAHLGLFPDMRTFGGYPYIPIKNPNITGLKG